MARVEVPYDFSRAYHLACSLGSVTKSRCDLEVHLDFNTENITATATLIGTKRFFCGFFTFDFDLFFSQNLPRKIRNLTGHLITVFSFLPAAAPNQRVRTRSSRTGTFGIEEG